MDAQKGKEFFLRAPVPGEPLLGQPSKWPAKGINHQQAQQLLRDTAKQAQAKLPEDHPEKHVQIDNLRCHGLRATTLTMMMQGGFTEAECNQYEGWQQADLRMSARYDRNYAGREVPSCHLAGCRQLRSRLANLD